MLDSFKPACIKTAKFLGMLFCFRVKGINTPEIELVFQTALTH